MKCKYCDGVITEEARFCPHCGVACQELRAILPVAPAPAPRVRQKKKRSPRVKADPRSVLRGMKCMKWHKFTVNFLLFVEFALMLAGGAAYFFGYAHSIDAALIYKYYPHMYEMDLIAAGGSCLLALMALVARFRLARLRKNGRGWLYGFYVAAILLPVGYLTAGFILFHASLVSLGYIIHVARCFLFLLISIIYYTRKKRRSVFAKLTAPKV